MITAIDRLRYSSDRCYDKTAIVFGSQKISYASMFEAVTASAERLSECGVKKGDMVAILQRNSPSFLINWYAIMAVGACAVMLNWRLTPQELCEAVKQTNCSLIVSDGTFKEALLAESACKEADFKGCVFLEAASYGVVSEADLLEAGTHFSDQSFVELKADDNALIFFTGGTTGRIKAAVHGHGGLSNWVDATLNNVWTVCSDDVMFNAAPLFHLGGMQVSYFTLSVGGTLVMPRDSLNAADVLDAVEKQRVTQINIIPQTLVQLLLAESKERKRDLSSVKYALLMGGAACEEYTLSAFEVFENAQVIHPYGMSELAATAIVRHTREDYERFPHRRLSVGRIGLSSRIKLVDDKGDLVPNDTAGRVFGKSDCMMKFYLDREEVFDAEGYLDTGDIMRRDSDGFLYYVGRNKLMIKTGGENVYCNEVEATIKLHPAVANCVAFGLPDKKWGEAISVAVEFKPGQSLSVEELIEHCRAHAAHYKQPRNVFLVDKLPLNPAGKVVINDVLKLLGLPEQK